MKRKKKKKERKGNKKKKTNARTNARRRGGGEKWSRKVDLDRIQVRETAFLLVPLGFSVVGGNEIVVDPLKSSSSPFQNPRSRTLERRSR